MTSGCRDKMIRKIEYDIWITCFFSKTVKGLEKDMNTLHNMVEVLNSQGKFGAFIKV